MLPAAPVNAELFRRACGQFATGIAILTTTDGSGRPHGMTINSFTSLSLDPPLVMAAIARTSTLLACFESATHYAINVLAASQRDLSDRFARRLESRFDGIEWGQGHAGSPLFPGALATLECRIAQVVNAGDHRVFIGEVQSAHLRDTEEHPLVFFRGRYTEIE